MLRERYADITIRDNDSKRIVAVVETKNRKGFTRQNADSWFEQFFDYLKIADASYVLLITLEAGYLWKIARAMQWSSSNATLFDFPMNSVVKRYSSDFKLNEDNLDKSQFEFLVMQWLSELEAGLHQQPLEEPEQLLARVGFLEIMQRSTALFEVAV